MRGIVSALTLSPAPEGFARWSLRLLEEKAVELHIVERASDNTIGRTKKNILKPHRRQQWVIGANNCVRGCLAG
jgi:hypothetical protein